MIRPRVARLKAHSWTILAAPGRFCCCRSSSRLERAAQHSGIRGDESTPGQFFTITEPITHDTLAHIRSATRQLVDRNASAEQATRPILVFEFLPGESAPGASEFGACYDLANLISKELAGAQADCGLCAEAVARVCGLASDRLH